MKCVEDVVLFLSDYTTRPPVGLNRYDKSVINSFADQVIFRNLGFTEKQASLALKIISKYSDKINQAANTNIDALLTTPVYRLSIRKSSSIKKITIARIDGSPWERSIKAEFPYNEVLVQRIRTERKVIGNPYWSEFERAWIFPLSEISITFLLSMSDYSEFDIDPEFVEYADAVRSVLNNMDEFVPMVDKADESYVYRNVSRYVPPLASHTVSDVLLEAKQRGINVWSEAVECDLEESNENSTVIKFLKNQDKDFHISLECLNDLSKIVLALSPAIFIIPAGSELTALRKIYDFAKSSGITEDQISVLFRLPTNIGKEFNEFVKANSLNGKLSKDTKITVVSAHIPKTVAKMKMRYRLVVNFNSVNPHYTIRQLISTTENVIYLKRKE